MMFRDPKRHAFYVQCEFIIRRTTTLVWELRRKQITIVERFLTDDRIFEEYWLSKHCITSLQHRLYRALWRECRARLPVPDIVVYFRCLPSIAEKRLREREAKRSGMREVPDVLVKQYVYELTKRYEQSVRSKLLVPTLIVNSVTMNVGNILTQTQAAVASAIDTGKPLGGYFKKEVFCDAK